MKRPRTTGRKKMTIVVVHCHLIYAENKNWPKSQKLHCNVFIHCLLYGAICGSNLGIKIENILGVRALSHVNTIHFFMLFSCQTPKKNVKENKRVSRVREKWLLSQTIFLWHDVIIDFNGSINALCRTHYSLLLESKNCSWMVYWLR